MSEWWLPALAQKPSQGDVVASVHFAAIVAPPVYLRHAQLGKDRHGWDVCTSPVVQKSTQRMHALAWFKSPHGLLLSHDCEIDKHKDNGRLLLAPVAQLTELPEPTRTTVIEQKSYALIPLPELPGLGMCFADLRSMTAVPATLVDASARVASMTEQARARLHAQLVAFLLRKKLPPAPGA
jgi:hypothetical protein